MLIHYVDINRYAFTRLIVFFSARSTDTTRADKFDRLLKAKYVFSSRKLEDELIPATYQLFADCYEGGNLEHARVFLLARLSRRWRVRSDGHVLPWVEDWDHHDVSVSQQRAHTRPHSTLHSSTSRSLSSLIAFLAVCSVRDCAAEYGMSW